MFIGNSNLMNKFSKIQLILTILILIVGCKPTNKQLSIFSSSPCQLPCWQDIYPGKTTKGEVINILSKLDFVDIETIVTRGEPWSIFDDGVIATLQSGKIKTEIYFKGDQVSLIGLSGNIDMEFSQAIQNLGEPKYIINTPMSGGMPLAPTSSFYIVAIDPEQGYEFSFDTRDLPNKLKNEIQPETMLSRISFFDPNDYEKILNAGIFSTPYLTGEETLRFMTPWSGYGSILEKYPPAIIK